MIQNSKPDTTLWYTQPADQWIKALPIGNGRLGAMIFGGTRSERLQLNDVTIWSGNPQPDADRKDAYKSLPELRSLIREGKYDQAATFAEQNFNSPAPYLSSYQT
jgi:alpha-L-fucosidase 2